MWSVRFQPTGEVDAKTSWGRFVRSSHFQEFAGLPPLGERRLDVQVLGEEPYHPNHCHDARLVAHLDVDPGYGLDRDLGRVRSGRLVEVLHEAAVPAVVEQLADEEALVARSNASLVAATSTVASQC